jgi:hypothetical protein
VICRFYEDIWPFFEEKVTMPRITFVLGEKDYFLDPEDYYASEFEENDIFEPDYIRIRPLDLHDNNNPVFLLGSIFLRKYFVIFDDEKNEVGITLLKSKPTT